MKKSKSTRPVNGPDEKGVGHHVPVRVMDKFNQVAQDKELVINQRFGAKDHVAGALFLWCYIPPAMQLDTILSALGLRDIPESWWQGVRQALLDYEESQSDDQPDTPDSTGKSK